MGSLVIQRLIEERSIPVPEAGCWLFLTTKEPPPRDYGRLSFKGTTQAAHRASYAAFKGPIPEGMLVCHKCDTPSCVNPEHLFLGAPIENTRDCVSKGRHHEMKKTHCPSA